jgi:mono/diheme cytochrome c family protein
MRHLLLGALAALGALGSGTTAWARPLFEEPDPTPPTFLILASPRITGVAPAEPTPAYLAGSRIAAVGDRALAIDADSGALLLADPTGAGLAQLPIGRDAALLAYDPIAKLAYVADRRGDRIVSVEVGDRLVVHATWSTPHEPYGVALTPDRRTLVVTAIADRALVAYDVATGSERWRAALDREPRGVAIAPDASRALIAHTGSNTIDDVALETHRVEHRAMCCPNARGGFAVTFMGAHQAVVPFQLSVPVGMGGAHQSAGRYGGVEFIPPITYHLALFGSDGARTALATAQTALNQPRAVAWDGARDALYVAGLGNDTILQVVHASQVDAAPGKLSGKLAVPRRCGPDGLAISGGGDLLVWCSFTRSVARIAVEPRTRLAGKPRPGPELVASALREPQHDGLVLFHSAIPSISEHGAIACASCHLDGRTDGLSWQIEGKQLQTPLLAGRLVGSGPFKWDGGSRDLASSLRGTITRLGGAGLRKPQTAALVAYLESLPAIRTPTRDPEPVARGKRLFDSDDLGCRGCHDGPLYTDRERHDFAGNLKHADTPSLLGLAASAPYFHDGSAASLEAVLRERGAVHGMAMSTQLSDAQIADLTAFLETL